MLERACEELAGSDDKLVQLEGLVAAGNGAVGELARCVEPIKRVSISQTASQLDLLTLVRA